MIEARETELSLPVLLYFARHFYLEEIDQQWIDHLKTMEALREGIGLRGYGQKDPKQEYKKEGFVMFGEMMGIIGRNVCEKLFHMQLRRERAAAADASQVPQPAAASARLGARSSRRGRRRRAAARGGRQATATARPSRRSAPVRRERAQGRPQRSVPVRQRQEVQEVPRRRGRRVTVGRRAGSAHRARRWPSALAVAACQTRSPADAGCQLAHAGRRCRPRR